MFIVILCSGEVVTINCDIMVEAVLKACFPHVFMYFH